MQYSDAAALFSLTEEEEKRKREAWLNRQGSEEENGGGQDLRLVAKCFSEGGDLRVVI